MQVNAVIAHIENWLRNYASNAGSTGFVVGVSGGIDSAVTSALCARTGMPTLLVDLPIHQAESQALRGQRHISALENVLPNVQSQLVDLSVTFETFKKSLPKPEDGSKWELSEANARARLRMTTLYYFAGMQGKLVVGTGNKVEDFGVGFFTKYGDGGVDLSPLADLNKTEVYELGAALAIDQEIMDAPPTDGLWGDDRTDEDQIGASYPELEWAMGYSGDPSSLTSRQQEVFQIYNRLHKANRHKMLPIPVCEIPENLKN